MSQLQGPQDLSDTYYEPPVSARHTLSISSSRQPSDRGGTQAQGDCPPKDTQCSKVPNAIRPYMPSRPSLFPLYVQGGLCHLGALDPSRSWCTVRSKGMTLNGEISESRTALTAHARGMVTTDCTCQRHGHLPSSLQEPLPSSSSVLQDSWEACHTHSLLSPLPEFLIEQV